MSSVETQINIWVDSFTGTYILQEQKPNRGLLIYASGESVPSEYLDTYGLGTDGNPLPQEVKMKIPKCGICKTPLKKLDNDRYMCDMSPNVCTDSLRILYLKLEEE